MNTNAAEIRFANYSACMEWTARHWQSAVHLEEVTKILDGFLHQKEMLEASAERSTYDVLVRTTSWQLDDQNSLPESEIGAIRWLDSPEQAQLLSAARPRKPLRLSVTDLAPDVAKALAAHSGDLHLPGVACLDWISARALAERATTGRKGAVLTLGFDIDGMDGLAGLEPLWSQPDSVIALPAVTRLDLQSAEVLGRLRGTLRLPNLKAIAADQAELLVQGCLTRLELDGLPDAVLSEPLAKALCSGQLNELSLSGLVKESPALSAIAGHGFAALRLDGLRQVSPDFAKDLGASRVLNLKLNGLSALDLPTARALCGQGRTFHLFLNGLTDLSDPVVGVLVGNTNYLLEIRQVKALSGAALKMLHDQGNVESPLLDS